MSSQKSVKKNESIFWTFSKAKRFYQPKKPDFSAFTDVPSTLSDRSCSFGQGKRWSPINPGGKDSPSPGAYESQSAFGLKNKGPSLKKRPQMKPKLSVPGPGSYSPYSPLGKHGPKFSFRVKTFLKNRVVTPPPGSYHPSFAIVDKGSFKNIGFGIGERSEIYGKLEDIPGPGSYNLRGAIKSAISTNRSNKKRRH